MKTYTKIFIVEDELIAAESLTMDLKQLGYQVVGQANSQEKALQKIKETNPDLVLMDIKIKGEKDGISIASELQKNKKIPVIYLTAYADDDTLQKAKETSPYGYIVKPYKIQDLQTTIVIALNQFEQASKLENKLIEQQQKLNYLAIHDPITQLPNQLSLVENFNGIVEYFYQLLSFEENEEILLENQEESYRKIIPIFYLKLYRFSLIREELGNDVANFILKGIAERLKRNVNSDALISRLEGDEFTIIIPPITTKQIAIDLAEYLLANIGQSFLYKKQEIFINLSIGISFYPLQGEQINELLINAKKSLQQNNQLGGNQYQVYSPAFHHNTSEQIILEADLHHAIERKELELYYQPQFEIKTGKIFGSEALLRWKHKERGLISPAVFIPLAEETGLIESIGEWVLKTACDETKTLQKKGFSNLKVSVNISGRQFKKNNFTQILGQILAITAFNSKYLDLELTESILINNPMISAQKLKSLKTLGVTISIDDFGTGYSSLGYLQNFHFDVLKIDRCFVKDINLNPKNSSITKLLIDLAHQLNLKVVAEGVETEEELEILKEYNCDYLQGYLFSRPLPFSDFETLLFSCPKSDFI